MSSRRKGAPVSGWWDARRKHIEATAKLFPSLFAESILNFDHLDKEQQDLKLVYKFRERADSADPEPLKQRLSNLDDSIFEFIADEIYAAARSKMCHDFSLRVLMEELRVRTPADRDHFFPSQHPQQIQKKFNDGNASSLRNQEVLHVLGQLIFYETDKKASISASLSDNILKPRRVKQLSELIKSLKEVCDPFPSKPAAAGVSFAEFDDGGFEDHPPSDPRPLPTAPVPQPVTTIVPPSAQTVRDTNDMIMEQLANGIFPGLMTKYSIALITGIICVILISHLIIVTIFRKRTHSA